MTPRSLITTPADRERFWRYVNKAGPMSRLGTVCWEWTRYRHKDSGYGVFSLKTGSAKAHRVSFVMAGGTIPGQHQVDHMCRNTSCVRPDHLEPVTDSENQRRKRHAIQDQLFKDVDAWEEANREEEP